MNYCGLSFYDTANGPGVRVSLFVSGCTLHCKGCFNKESWDFQSGNPFTKEVEDRIIETLKNPYIDGLSVLGGDPFERDNEKELVSFLARVKKECPQKSIWCWTGRVLHHIEDSPLIQYIDVLVDGPFIEKLKVKDHKWFGSSNQKIHYLTKI